MIDDCTTQLASMTAPGSNTVSCSVTLGPTTQSRSTTELMSVALTSTELVGDATTPDDVVELVELLATVEDIDVGLEVGLGVRVQPVRVVGHRKECAVCGQCRKRLALDTDSTRLGDALKHAGLEDVGARV